MTGDTGGWLVEDLSVDYAQRSDTGSVPDATSTAGLLLLGLALMVFAGSRLPLRMVALVS